MNVLIWSAGSVSNVGKNWKCFSETFATMFLEKNACPVTRVPALWIFLVLPKPRYWSYLWDTPCPAQSRRPGPHQLCCVDLWAFGFSEHSGDFVLLRQLLFSCTFLHSTFHIGQVNIFSNTPQAGAPLTHPLVCGNETGSCRCMNSASHGAEDKLCFCENLVPSEGAGIVSQPTSCLILHILLFQKQWRWPAIKIMNVSAKSVFKMFG